MVIRLELLFLLMVVSWCVIMLNRKFMHSVHQTFQIHRGGKTVNKLPIYCQKPVKVNVLVRGHDIWILVGSSSKTDLWHIGCFLCSVNILLYSLFIKCSLSVHLSNLIVFLICFHFSLAFEEDPDIETSHAINLYSADLRLETTFIFTSCSIVIVRKLFVRKDV